MAQINVDIVILSQEVAVTAGDAQKLATSMGVSGRNLYCTTDIQCSARSVCKDGVLSCHTSIVICHTLHGPRRTWMTWRPVCLGPLAAQAGGALYDSLRRQAQVL